MSNADGNSPPTGIDRLVTALTRYRAPAVFNPWAERCELDVGRHPAAERRRRLRAHLGVLGSESPGPHLVLIGEALGYQGGRCTGVAFTSERLVLEGAIPRVTTGLPRLSKRPLPWSEPSASIVWGTLADAHLSARTVLFNAYPWHPMGARGPFSNRRPSEPERRMGLPLLAQLLDVALSHHPRTTIGAVGRSAERSLRDLGHDFVALRHPAYGGAARFAAGVRAIAAT